MNKQINYEVELLRNEMEKIAIKSQSLSHPIVLEASERLDKIIYIVQFNRRKQWEK